MLKAEAHTLGYILGRLDVITFYVNDSHRHIHSLGHCRDDFDFRKFAAGHFQVHFVAFKIEKRREHGGQTTGTHRASLVVSKTKMSAQPDPPRDALDGAVEQVDKTPCLFPVRVATHRRLIQTNLAAP